MSESNTSINCGGCFGFLLFLVSLYFCIVFFGGCRAAPDGEGLRGGTKAVIQDVRDLWSETECKEESDG